MRDTETLSIKDHQLGLVLLSGGLDSTTALYIALDHAVKHGGKVIAVSIDYGQRHLKETQIAREHCDRLGIEHQILKMDFAGDCMLTNKDTVVPDISYDDIKGVSPTYVPFRNGMMLSRLAAFAQTYVQAAKKAYTGDKVGYIGEDYFEDLVTIYFGAHAEDAKAWAYPDCTPEYIGAMANAIYIGTYRTVRLSAPFTALTKTQIVEWGTKLNVPYQDTWSCYKGGEYHCGRCPTCRSRKAAFIDARLEDPTKYAA